MPKVGGVVGVVEAHLTLNQKVETLNSPGGAGGPMDKTSGS